MGGAGLCAGGMLAVAVGVTFCDCEIFEANDDWKIETETRNGERGAGWLYKRGKNAAVWSKRYFAITETKLIYYMDMDRTVMKGEIVLVGASARESSIRSDAKKKYYFIVSHPQCGSRELCAKSRNRRNQWIQKINDIASELERNGAVYGKLLKQGGLSKNTWQERWCVCAGNTIDYFDNVGDNQSKGCIELLNANIREFTQKDKVCFEISTANPGKKGSKKYVFSLEREGERTKWSEALKRATLPVNVRLDNASTKSAIENDDDDDISQTSRENSVNNNNNPMHSKTISVDKDNIELAGLEPRPQSFTSSLTSISLDKQISGYLFKKSPSAMAGWQKRFFKTLNNGDIAYFKSEEDANQDKDQKGVILLADIRSDCDIDVNKKTYEFTIKTTSKNYVLKANFYQEGLDWADSIEVNKMQFQATL